MAANTVPGPPPHQASQGLAVQFKLNEAQFGDGYEQVSIDGINHEREAWNLTWKNEDRADVNNLVQFFTDQGGDKPFFWQAPTDDEPKLWRARGVTTIPTSTDSSTLTVEYKRWFGEEP